MTFNIKGSQTSIVDALGKNTGPPGEALDLMKARIKGCGLLTLSQDRHGPKGKNPKLSQAGAQRPGYNLAVDLAAAPGLSKSL